MRRTALLLTIAGVTAGCGAAPEPRPSAPAVLQSAFAQGPSTPRADTAEKRRPAKVLDGRHVIARVSRAVIVRRTPGGRALRRIGRRTEFGSPQVLAVLERRSGWLRIQTARLPNGRSGWIPAGAVTLDATEMSLHVDRSKRRLTLRDGDRVVRRVTVAVGRPGTETPLGRFAVTDKLRPQDPASPYGCCAIALTGHQTKIIPGWPGGDRLAIHGTPATWSVGKAVSLGCMRAHRRDLEALFRRVPLGTPIFIRA